MVGFRPDGIVVRMEILSEEELGARIDFKRPLHPEPEKRPGLWCIPFEWGLNGKGTLITIAKAKEIAAELRASVAEAEKRELRHYFDEEKERTAEFGRQLSAERDKTFAAQSEVAILRHQLRTAKKKR